MIVRAEIIKIADPSNKIIVEKEGSNRPKTLLAFYWACHKYANKDHKVLKFETSDMTVLAEISQRFPHIPCELIPDKGEVIEPEGLNPT